MSDKKKPVGCAAPADLQSVPGGTPESNAIANAAAQVEVLQTQLAEATGVILEQEDTLVRLLSDPLVWGTVLSQNHDIDPEVFLKGDKCLVVDDDPAVEAYTGRMGTIVSDGIDRKSGTVKLEFFGIKNKPHFAVGLQDVLDPDTQKPKKRQIVLLNKNDGTNIVVGLNDKVIEVWNTKLFNPKPGDTAKVHIKTNQVVQIGPPQDTGALCTVGELLGPGKIEIEGEGNKRIVSNYIPEVEVGDKVVIDPTGHVVVRHLANADTTRYKIKEEFVTRWSDIGGQEVPKRELYEALVLPDKFPDIIKHYKHRIPAGFLLYGPPGCGKTLLGKAAASALAELHGKQAVQSGFNYVKGPEILSKWVGESEAQTRSIFARMRKHYELHGYPCVTFIDECDALFTERGGDNTQKWHDTLVAMWLAEMDGFDRKAGVLILATNRPKALDGAIVRPGRIDKHIKVERPNRVTSPDILRIHMDGIPLAGTDIKEFTEVIARELTENVRPLYNVTCKQSRTQHQFTLADCISGAMLANVCDEAKTIAMRRDMDALAANKKAKPTGVRLEDALEAVNLIYHRTQSVSHRFDLVDFYETRGLNENAVSLEKIACVG